jgi:hypothetical protein
LVFRGISRQVIAQLFRHALHLPLPKRRDVGKLRAPLLEYEESTEILSCNSLRRVGGEQSGPYDFHNILFWRNFLRERPHRTP